MTWNFISRLSYFLVCRSKSYKRDSWRDNEVYWKEGRKKEKTSEKYEKEEKCLHNIFAIAHDMFLLFPSFPGTASDIIQYIYEACWSIKKWKRELNCIEENITFINVCHCSYFENLGKLLFVLLPGWISDKEASSLIRMNSVEYDNWTYIFSKLFIVNCKAFSFYFMLESSGSSCPSFRKLKLCVI